MVTKSEIETVAAPEPTVVPGAETRPADETDGVVGGRSKALGRNVTRLQREEVERLNREEQERLARLREKARMD